MRKNRGDTILETDVLNTVLQVVPCRLYFKHNYCLFFNSYTNHGFNRNGLQVDFFIIIIFNLHGNFKAKIIAIKHGTLFSLTDASAWARTKLNSIKQVILPYDIVTQHRCPFIGFLSKGRLAIPNWQVGLGMISKEIRDYFKCLSSNLNQPFCNSFWSRINYCPSVLHSFIQA